MSMYIYIHMHMYVCMCIYMPIHQCIMHSITYLDYRYYVYTYITICVRMCIALRTDCIARGIP